MKKTTIILIMCMFILSGIAFAIMPIGPVLGDQLQRESGEILKGCVESKNSDNVLCYEMEVINEGDSISGRETITLTPTVPKVGDWVGVAYLADIGEEGFSITANNLELRGPGVSGIIDSWELPIPAECYVTPCRVMNHVEFLSPSVVGSTYELTWEIYSFSRRMYQESKIFSIGAAQCPSSFYSQYNFYTSISNGDVHSRNHYTYSGLPYCAESIDVQFQTYCDSGYECDGSCIQYDNYARCVYVDPCNPTCGDDFCDFSCGETPSSCAADCASPTTTTTTSQSTTTTSATTTTLPAGVEVDTITNVDYSNSVNYDEGNDNYRLQFLAPSENVAFDAGDEVTITLRINNEGPGNSQGASGMYVQCSILNEEGYPFLDDVPLQSIVYVGEVIENCESTDPATSIKRVVFDTQSTFADIQYKLPVPAWGDKTNYVYCAAFEQCHDEGTGQDSYTSSQIKRPIVIHGEAPSCEGVVCNDVCSGYERQYDGACNEDTGACVYLKQIACANGCNPLLGQCRENSCEDVICYNRCDGNRLEIASVCSEGECVYDDDVNCPSGCTDQVGEDSYCSGDEGGVVMPQVEKYASGWGNWVSPYRGKSFFPYVSVKSTYITEQNGVSIEVGIYCNKLKEEVLTEGESRTGIFMVENAGPCLESESSFVARTIMKNVRPGESGIFVMAEITVPEYGTKGGVNSNINNYPTDEDPICVIRANTFDKCYDAETGVGPAEKYTHADTRRDSYFNGIVGEWCYPVGSVPEEGLKCCTESDKQGEGSRQYYCRNDDGTCAVSDTCTEKTDTMVLSGDAFENPNNPKEFCVLKTGMTQKESCAQGSYPKKDVIDLSELADMDDLKIELQKFNAVFEEDRDIQEFIMDTTNHPVCVYAFGDAQCEFEDAECVRALNRQGAGYSDNLQIYVALEDQLLGDWYKFWNTKAEEEVLVEQYGVCLPEQRDVFSKIKASIADMFGLDPKDPAVNGIIVGIVVLLIVIFSMVTRPPKPKQQRGF